MMVAPDDPTQEDQATAVQHDSDEISLGDDNDGGDDHDNKDHDDDDDDHGEGSETGATTREQQQQQQQQGDDEKEVKSNVNDNPNPMENDKPPNGSTSNTIPPTNKMTPIQKRMYELKLKMNQSRQLNRREVMDEGQRLSSSYESYKKQQRQEDQKSLKEEWETSITSKSIGDTEKERQAMCQSATEFQKKSSKKQSKADMNRYAVDDHYNPEGQFRNYERNLKSVPRSSRGASEQEGDDQIFNPVEALIGGSSDSAQREGARRLANELHRRQMKSKESRDKRSREDAIEGDVAYINQRNKKFNQKISRNFDKHTAEIRHNLERGTAS